MQVGGLAGARLRGQVYGQGANYAVARLHRGGVQVQPGDCVIGTLPVNLAAQVCARQATYLHLSLDIPAQARGQELSAEQLQTLGATLQQFHVQSHKVKPAP